MPAHRKHPSGAKADTRLHLRLTPEDLELIRQAAERARLPMAAWARTILLREATDETPLRRRVVP